MPGADDVHDELDRDAFDAVEFSDEELAALALDAVPFDPFGPDVAQFGDDPSAEFPVVPRWYRSAPGVARSRPRAAIMLGFAIALVLINIGIFAVALGFPEIGW